MLQKFFASSTIIIIVMTALMIAKAIQTYRFMVRADTAFKLYGLLDLDFSKLGDIEIPYGRNRLKFASTTEVCAELEKLYNEALEHYDKIGWYANMDETLKVKKDKLIDMYNKVRIMKWQGV